MLVSRAARVGADELAAAGRKNEQCIEARLELAQTIVELGEYRRTGMARRIGECLCRLAPPSLAL